jgi:hypothetical protein
MADPERYAVVLQTPAGECSFTCGRDEFIWNAAAADGILLPAICHQGRCLPGAGRPRWAPCVTTEPDTKNGRGGGRERVGNLLRWGGWGGG